MTNVFLFPASGSKEVEQHYIRTILNYVETHHIKPLEGGGTDTADNMIAVCPNCHKKLTYGSSKIKEDLMGKI